MLSPLRARPELSLGQATVLLASSVLGIAALADPAHADGGGLSRVTCHQGAPGCSLGVSEHRVVRPPSRPGSPASARGGSGGGLSGISERFAKDSTMCLGLGALAPACIAANAAKMFGGGHQAVNAAPATVAPIVVARRATARLRLPDPEIHSSPAPGTEQLVGLAIWLWIDRSSWTERSATAAVPGVSVTAQARPSHVRWDMGDGTTENCAGPGTPWHPGSPGSASPTCGHVYRHSSAGRPHAAFTVTATVTWAISWSGGGQSGTLPALSTSSATRMRVAESQAVNGG